LIGDCLAVYCDKHGPNVAGRVELQGQMIPLIEFFGDKPASCVGETKSNQYVQWRCAQKNRRAKKNGRHIKPSTARRELVTLAAALNWCARNKDDRENPILNRPVFVHLPKAVNSPKRWLNRSEVARLLWGALGFNAKGERNRAKINRHLARFLLMYFYTGTRHTAILRLQWLPNVNGGWIDFDSGIIYRRPQEARETNKRRPPCPIPDRLAPHLRRWRRMTARYVIEYDGKPITSKIRRAFASARELAGFGPDVTPHTLKHSCATVLLRDGKSTRQVSAVLGTSEQVIQNTYGHHAMDEMRATFNDVWSRKRASK
jgi:integrase